jgi:hypothetical protein
VCVCVCVYRYVHMYVCMHACIQREREREVLHVKVKAWHAMRGEQGKGRPRTQSEP